MWVSRNANVLFESSEVVLDHRPQTDQRVPVLDPDVRGPDPLLNEPEHGAGILLPHSPAASRFAHPPFPSAVQDIGGNGRAVLTPGLIADWPATRAAWSSAASCCGPAPRWSQPASGRPAR